MSWSVITQAQLSELLADAELGRLIRQTVECAARSQAEEASQGPDAPVDEAAAVRRAEAIGEDVTLDPELFAGIVDIRRIAESTVSEVLEAALATRQDHAEAERDIARGLR